MKTYYIWLAIMAFLSLPFAFTVTSLLIAFMTLGFGFLFGIFITNATVVLAAFYPAVALRHSASLLGFGITVLLLASLVFGPGLARYAIVATGLHMPKSVRAVPIAPVRSVELVFGRTTKETVQRGETGDTTYPPIFNRISGDPNIKELHYAEFRRRRHEIFTRRQDGRMRGRSYLIGRGVSFPLHKADLTIEVFADTDIPSRPFQLVRRLTHTAGFRVTDNRTGKVVSQNIATQFDVVRSLAYLVPAYDWNSSGGPITGHALDWRYQSSPASTLQDFTLDAELEALGLALAPV